MKLPMLAKPHPAGYVSAGPRKSGTCRQGRRDLPGAQSRRWRIVSIVGARPQFIKAFPFSRAVRAHPALEEVLVHTGQHFDANMSDIFFRELGIAPPHHAFDIHGGSHAAMTGRMLTAIEEVLVAEMPDAVVVYGDTNSTLAGALAAAKLHIPVVHIEAGLRSFNRRMPEEINRVVADHVSTLLLCPTRLAVENLAAEGITRGVHNPGDLMFDATLLATVLAEKHARILATLNLSPGHYALATVHRAENTDDPAQLAKVVAYLKAEAEKQPVVLPLHPRTQHALAAAGLDTRGLIVIDPVGYLDMSQLLHHAARVFTDSGGLQKEAYFHRVPCVTLRGETEWVETISHGWNRLWTDPGYAPRKDIREYGDGHAAEAMAEIIVAYLSRA
ncbi:MAG TPA: UDP-N-acetylglucosamine 2-epimerase (non-hydrolyzing) [Rhizomicrobium sp.]|jgi:UDP-GlcNAc3NAcA epimerase